MVLYRINRFIKYYCKINSIKTWWYYNRLNYSTLEEAITIVITSSGRLNYLKETMDSLIKNNQTNARCYWHIIDDNPNCKDFKDFSKKYDFDLKIINKRNQGLGYCLNRIYRTIKTKYIFHCEDDWLFKSQINLTQLINILESRSYDSQLILKREQPYKTDPVKRNNIYYLDNYYSFNPHLVRTDIVSKLIPFSMKNTEKTATNIARRNNIFSEIVNYLEEPIVSHIGFERSMVKY